LFSNPLNPAIIAAIMDDQSSLNADHEKSQVEQPALLEEEAPAPVVPAAARSTRRRKKK
jgi:hypothetical protein